MASFQGRTIAVIGLALIAFAIYLPNVYCYFVPTFGCFPLSNSRWAYACPGQKAVLAAGDRVEYEKLPLSVRYSNDRRPYPGTTVSFPIVHNGSERTVTLTSRAYVPPLTDAIVLALRKIAQVLFVLIAAAIVLLRPSRMTWAFYAYALGNVFVTVPFLSFLPVRVFWTLQFSTWLFAYVGQLGLLDFALRFPSDRVQGWRAATERALPLIFALQALYAAVVLWFVTAGGVSQSFEYQALNNSAIPVYALAWYALLSSYRGANEALRLRLRWAIAGVSAGTFVLISTDFFYYARFIPEAAQGILVGIGQLLIPLAIGYTILRHRIIDVQFVLNRTIVLGVIGLAAAAVFAAVDWLFTSFVPLSRSQMGISIAAAFLFGLLVAKTYARLITLVDAMLFPKRHAATDCLNRLRLAIESENDSRNVGVLLSSQVCGGLRLASGAVFSASVDGGFIREAACGWNAGTAWHLLDDDVIVQRARATRKTGLRLDERACKDVQMPAGLARPLLLFAIVSRRKIVAMILYGAHTNGADIDPDEARGLAQLCAAAAPTFDHVAPVSFGPAAVSLAP